MCTYMYKAPTKQSCHQQHRDDALHFLSAFPARSHSLSLRYNWPTPYKVIFVHTCMASRLLFACEQAPLLPSQMTSLLHSWPLTFTLPTKGTLL